MFRTKNLFTLILIGALVSLGFTSECLADANNADKSSRVLRVGSGCGLENWCFSVTRLESGLEIIEVPTRKGTLMRTTFQPSRHHFSTQRFSTQCGEFMPEFKNSGNVMSCPNDEPVSSTCGFVTKMNCWEIYDQGDYTVIITYGWVPMTPIQVELGPPLEEEEEDDDGGEEDGK